MEDARAGVKLPSARSWCGCELRDGGGGLPEIELAWGKFELGFLFVFGKDEVGGKMRATFGDQFLNEARAAVGDEALDFLDGEFFAAEHALYLKNTAQGAIGLRFGDVERLGREHERARRETYS